MECPNCLTSMSRNGHRRQKQRWICPRCGATVTENPSRAGRPCIGKRVMTAAERKRKSRAAKKKEQGN